MRPALLASCWALSLLISVALGLGAWQYSFPHRAVWVSGISNDWLGWLIPRLRPDTFLDWTEPSERSTWRAPTGHYVKGGTVYLRVPRSEAAALAVDLTSELPDGSELLVRLSGETVLRQPLRAGYQMIVTPPLPSAPIGAIVPVQFELPSQEALANHAAVPLVIHGLRFTRGRGETTHYQLEQQRRAITEQMRAVAEQMHAEAERLRVSAERSEQAERLLREQLADYQARLHEHQARLQEQEQTLEAKEDALREAQAEIDRLRSRAPPDSPGGSR